MSLDKLVNSLQTGVKQTESDVETAEPKTPQQLEKELTAYQTAQGARLQTLNINRNAPAPQPQSPAKSLPPFKTTPRNGFRR